MIGGKLVMDKQSVYLNKSVEKINNNRVLFIIAIMIAGFNLRPAITSVGPLLGTIRDEIGLANWSAGIITSLPLIDRKSTRLNSSHVAISYAVFCLKKKKSDSDDYNIAVFAKAVHSYCL